MKKRRQHYVWQHYLQAWTKRGKIACLRDGGTFFTSTVNVAVQRDFYRLKELNVADMHFLGEICLKTCLPELRPLHEGWISTFTRVFEFKRRYEALVGQDPEAARMFDEAINNLEEELHSQIESESIWHLECLRNRELSFFADSDQAAGFLHFLCVQYMRTDKIRANTIEALRTAGIESENVWGVMAHIFATNIGYYLFTSRNKIKMTILETSAGSELITSDQPVINVRALDVPFNMPPEELELYYPVSPTTALLLQADHPEGGTDTRILNPADVANYNNAMFRLAYSQVFALDERILRSIREGNE